VSRLALERYILALALVVAAGAVTSCGGSEDEAPLPPRPATVRLTMDEYRFGYDRSIPSGRVVFRARNVGRKDHSLTLLRLPPNVPPLNVQIRSKKRIALPPLAILKRRGPGKAGTFAVDLTPGRYGLICTVRDSNGEPNSLKGMNSEFHVP
jgi:hypothetical protein